MKKILFLAIILLLVSCTTQIPAEKQCSTNKDCVKATCCHASEAVNRQFAPDCTDIFCTQVCQPNTIDCGQGEIQCKNKQCQVILY